MSISLIAALSENGVIGNENQLPWHLPADLAWFKQQTLNKSVIMGRRTYESIGFALPNRTNYVLSRHPFSAKKVIHCYTLSEVLEYTQAETEVMIIGGAQLYQQFLPYCSHLYLTHIGVNCTGDTKFPDYLQYPWHPIFSEQHYADSHNCHDYRFEILARELTTK